MLCVQMKNHHTSWREQIAMQLNQVAINFDFAEQNCYAIFKKEIIPCMDMHVCKCVCVCVCVCVCMCMNMHMCK